MIIRALIFALAASGAGFGALRVEQIIQAPAQPGQRINSLTTDGKGNLIVTGSNSQGGFISKLAASGAVVFTFANFGAYPAGAAVDTNGDVYWIGAGGAPGFPFPFTKKVMAVPQLGSVTPGFVVKFRGTDGAIIWAAEVDAMQPQATVLDTNGFIMLAGGATATPGLVTAGAYQSPATGTVPPLSIFRLTPDGDAVFAATYGGHSINGTSSCVIGPWGVCSSDPRTTATSLLLDADGHIWVAGSTNETDLPLTPDALKTVCGCSLNSGDGYLAEFSADGSSLLYATYLGTSTHGETDSSGNDAILSATMDHSGRIWLGGTTNGMDLLTTPDAVQASLLGDADGFVLEYDTMSNKLVYGTYYGAHGTNSVTGLVIGPDGRVTLAGILNANPANPYSFGDDFVATLNPSGIEVTAFLRYGADAGLAFSPSGSLVVAGSGNVIAMMKESSATSPSIFGVANSASLDAAGQVSPGEIVTIVGANLGPANPVTASLPVGQNALATQLGGVQALFDGVAAPLLFVSSTQINAIVPFGIADRHETTLIVENAGASSNAAQLGVVSATPAIFTMQTAYQNLPVAAALNEDGTINTETNRAVPGSVVSVLATGFGALVRQPQDGSLLSATPPALQQNIEVFGPGFVQVLYAGPAPGQVAGAMQVNFRLPESLTQTPTIFLFAGGWASPYFTVWVSGT